MRVKAIISRSSTNEVEFDLEEEDAEIVQAALAKGSLRGKNEAREVVREAALEFGADDWFEAEVTDDNLDSWEVVS